MTEASRIPAAVYDRLAQIARDQFGLELGQQGMVLLANRLGPRLDELGGLSFAGYLARITEQADERAVMAELLCTHETRFFREPQHFEFIAERLAPAWRRAAALGARGRQVRVWSAACSSGEEPFTLAMVLRDALPVDEGWTIEIVASDLSRRVLAQAAAATWSIARAEPIPDALLRRHMLRGYAEREGTFRARPELRALVRFEHHNLLEPAGGLGMFDLVMCRNVLIYFHREQRAHVLANLLGQLHPRGHLIVGHAESLIGIRSELRPVQPTVYAYEPGAR